MTMLYLSRLGSVMMGYTPLSPNNNIASNQINVAGTYFGISFIPSRAVPISKIRVYFASVTGSLSAGDIKGEIWSNSATGQPSALIEAASGTSPSPIVAGGAQFTGFTTTPVAYNKYWFVLYNVNATPASNNPMLRTGTSNTAPMGAGGLGGVGSYGPTLTKSTNSGGSWITQATQINPFMTIEYNDGVIEGLSFYNIVTSTFRAYGSNKFGVKFTTPKYMRFSMASVALAFQKQGSPSAGILYEVRDVATDSLIASSSVVDKAELSTSSFIYAQGYFDSLVTLEPNTAYRILAKTSEAIGDTSNYYRANTHLIENVSQNSGSKPFNGTLVSTQHNGTAYTDNSLEIVPFVMCGDVDTEFVSHNGIYVPRGSAGGR